MRELLSFEGRIGRRAFVLIQLTLFTIGYFAAFLFIVASGAGDEHLSGVTPPDAAVVGALFFAFLFLLGWISLAATVKRCHDRNLSGWMLLFAFPPILGQLWLVLNLLTGPSLRPASLASAPRLSQSAALA